jgi:hypothetical protein
MTEAAIEWIGLIEATTRGAARLDVALSMTANVTPAVRRMGWFM